VWTTHCLSHILCCCWVRLYLQLCVGGVISYLRYLCLFAHSGVQHILWCGFACLSSSCVPYVAFFSGLSNFDCQFDFYILYLKCKFQQTVIRLKVLSFLVYAMNMLLSMGLVSSLMLNNREHFKLWSGVIDIGTCLLYRKWDPALKKDKCLLISPLPK